MKALILCADALPEAIAGARRYGVAHRVVTCSVPSCGTRVIVSESSLVDLAALGAEPLPVCRSCGEVMRSIDPARPMMVGPASAAVMEFLESGDR